jgi:tRNA-dihydrouridine synthase
MSAGRPPVLDETKCCEICAMISVGCTIQAAARYVGCSRNTIRREAARNPQFGEQLRRAEMQARIQPVRTLQDAAGRDWRAAAWLLERSQPDEYARTAANVVRLETVHDLMARCLALINEEFADSPESQTACQRLTQAIETTCGELTVAALTNRDPKRLRKVIARMTTRPQIEVVVSQESHQNAQVVPK